MAQYVELSNRLKEIEKRASDLYMSILCKNSLDQLLKAIDLHDFLKATNIDLTPPECVVLTSNGAADTAVVNKALPEGSKLYLAPWVNLGSRCDLELKIASIKHYAGDNASLQEEARRRAYSEMYIC